VRNVFLQQRTAIISQARGLLGERGIIILQSPEALKKPYRTFLRKAWAN
jgi:transposase